MILKTIKKFFALSSEAPPLPRGQADYVSWLRKNHPAYSENSQPDEQGGPRGPEPTRYNTWERGGIDVDF